MNSSLRILESKRHFLYTTYYEQKHQKIITATDLIALYCCEKRWKECLSQESLLERLKRNQFINPNTQAWLQFGVTVDRQTIPPISDALLALYRDFYRRGLRPKLLLDLGHSIEELDNLHKAYLTQLEESMDFEILGHNGEILAKADSAARRNIYEVSGNVQWLLVLMADYGVLPGSRNKTYDAQLQHMQDIWCTATTYARRISKLSSRTR